MRPLQTCRKRRSFNFNGLVGATIGRPPTYRSNAFSGTVSCKANGHGRAMLAPTRVFRQSEAVRPPALQERRRNATSHKKTGATGLNLLRLFQFVKEPHHQAAQQPSAASKIQKNFPKACKQRRFHAQFASFFRFMAANLSLTHSLTN